jgi:hypothetical protein
MGWAKMLASKPSGNRNYQTNRKCRTSTWERAQPVTAAGGFDPPDSASTSGFSIALALCRRKEVSMERRSFIGLVATVPLGRHVSRVRSPRPVASMATGEPRPKHQVAVLLLVVPPADFQPKSWRSVPNATKDTPYEVVSTLEPRAAGIARQVAKEHNVAQLKEEGGPKTWCVVAMTDGRSHRAESEVRS